MKFAGHWCTHVLADFAAKVVGMNAALLMTKMRSSECRRSVEGGGQLKAKRNKLSQVENI